MWFLFRICLFSLLPGPCHSVMNGMCKGSCCCHTRAAHNNTAQKVTCRKCCEAPFHFHLDQVLVSPMAFQPPSTCRKCRKCFPCPSCLVPACHGQPQTVGRSLAGGRSGPAWQAQQGEVERSQAGRRCCGDKGGRGKEARGGRCQGEPCLVIIISIFVSSKSIFTLQTRSCLTSTTELAQTVMKVSSCDSGSCSWSWSKCTML